MNVLKRIEETQKQLFNNNSTVQIEDSSYIYPLSTFKRNSIVDNSLNRYYRGDIKKKMFNIYDNDIRSFEMIEYMNNKKKFERIMKEKEIQRHKLYQDIYNEDVSKSHFGNQNVINISNFEEKLKGKMFSSEHGNNIMYLLMKFLSNRPKNDIKRKINKKLDGLYIKKNKGLFSNKLNALLNNKNNNSPTLKSLNDSKDLSMIKTKRHDYPYRKMNTYKKEKNIKYDLIEIRRSKSLVDLKLSSKNNTTHKDIIDIEKQVENLKGNLLNKNNDSDFQSLNNKYDWNNSINQEKLNNHTNEKSLFKRRIHNNKSNLVDDITINIPHSQRKIFYKHRKEFEKTKRKINDKYFDFTNFKINNLQNKSNVSEIDLQKDKRSLLSNILKICNRAEEISQQISMSQRNDKSINDKENIKTIIIPENLTKRKNNIKFEKVKLTKEEKENMVKYDEKYIVYSNKSDYSLLHTNLHFFGKNRRLDDIDNFKHNFSSEIRKQFIKRKRNLFKINMKRIVKKFNPHYKFF